MQYVMLLGAFELVAFLVVAVACWPDQQRRVPPL